MQLSDFGFLFCQQYQDLTGFSVWLGLLSDFWQLGFCQQYQALTGFLDWLAFWLIAQSEIYVQRKVLTLLFSNLFKQYI